jgi:Na+-translocating ferredoxin:NAD+ oxidoreductase subunit B
MYDSDDVYRRLAKVLDTLPNGFPATADGVELKLLRKIFTPAQAELFCQLRLTFETAAEIARRTGRPVEGLEEALVGMAAAGQLFELELGGIRFFRMMPWVFGIFEFQLPHLDRELAELSSAYFETFGRQFSRAAPPLMQVLPVEEQIEALQTVLPYERVSALVASGQSFRASDCICKHEQELLGKPCERPLRVCLAIAPIPGVFEDTPTGTVLSREEALALLQDTEEAGLVHLTSNVQHGHMFICNCCGCCCGILRAINHLGLPAGQVVNSRYYAAIDGEACTGCGICADERCQVGAIAADEGGIYRVVQERCIGCGLCVGTCPTGAVRLVRKAERELADPPLTEQEWFAERGRRRGVDFSDYR